MLVYKQRTEKGSDETVLRFDKRFATREERTFGHLHKLSSRISLRSLQANPRRHFMTPLDFVLK